ncbi:hypothetical protein, partial [Klebsiella aerogenes]
MNQSYGRLVSRAGFCA